MSKNAQVSGGMGVLGWTFIAFLVLKLTGFISWSWWWVTAPLWGGFAIASVVFIIALVVMLIKAGVSK